MGTTINGHKYSLSQVIGQVESFIDMNNVPMENKLPVSEFIDKIAPEFGEVNGDMLYTVYNEYYSDSGYNPAAEFERAIQLYYGTSWERTGNFLSLYYDWYSEGANAIEVLDELGLSYYSEDDDE